MRCSALQCVAVCCSVLQCVAVCCSVLQCVAVSFVYDVHLECYFFSLESQSLSSVNPKSTSNQPSKPCTVLQYPTTKECYFLSLESQSLISFPRSRLLRSVDCSVLQCVAVCCSVLQCVAVCCSVGLVCHVSSNRVQWD